MDVLKKPQTQKYLPNSRRAQKKREPTSRVLLLLRFQGNFLLSRRAHCKQSAGHLKKKCKDKKSAMNSQKDTKKAFGVTNSHKTNQPIIAVMPHKLARLGGTSTSKSGRYPRGAVYKKRHFVRTRSCKSSEPYGTFRNKSLIIAP